MAVGARRRRGVVAGGLLLASLLGLGACGGPGESHGGGTGQPGPPSTTLGPTSTIRPPASSTTTAPTPPTEATTTTAPPPTTTTTPTQAVPAGLAGTEWTTIPTSRKVVALTFDAGANADGVSSILATLRRDGVRATFFLTGTFVRTFPGAARAIASAGERIGNHSADHPYFTTLTDAEMRSQVLTAASQIEAVTGKDPWPWFRFPYLDRNSHTISVVNSVGYVPIGCTVDTLGWEGTSGGITAATVVSRVLAALRPGEIVLMHVGSNPTDHTTLDADALPTVIRDLRAKGYSFVTLDALS